eukprot:15304499-Alexandrium_andersonii.AAC.1
MLGAANRPQGRQAAGRSPQPRFRGRPHPTPQQNPPSVPAAAPLVDCAPLHHCSPISKMGET